MRFRTKMILILAGLTLLCPSLSFAEDTTADNMEIFVEKIRADKKLLVAQNMQLTEAEAKGFWPLYDRYQHELFLLRQRTLNLINDYGEAYEQMTDKTAKKLLNEYMTIENLGLKLRETYLPKFRKVMFFPEVKVLRYYQIENKINAVLFYELASKHTACERRSIDIRKGWYYQYEIHSLYSHSVTSCHCRQPVHGAKYRMGGNSGGN